MQNSGGRTRAADVAVRVGSHKLDNYHRTGPERPQFTVSEAVPLDDNARAIRRRLGSLDDRSYRAAAQKFIQVQTSDQTRVAAEDDSDDFSKEEPATYSGSAAPVKPIPPDWTDRLRRLSAVFARTRL